MESKVIWGVKCKFLCSWNIENHHVEAGLIVDMANLQENLEVATL